VTVEQAMRQKTITWHDPQPGAALGRTMSGLEYLQAIMDGRIPPAPICAHFDLWLVSVAEGEVVFAARPDESHYNTIGSVHGGVAATLLDSAVGCAVHSILPAGTGYTSVELKISFVRGISASSGEVRATGRVVKSGSRVAFAEGDLRDESGKLLGTASSTCLIIQQ
jgi:uncharacterized protein (TIGR00369 family)